MSLAFPLSTVHIRTNQTAGMGPGAGPAEQARSSVWPRGDWDLSNNPTNIKLQRLIKAGPKESRGLFRENFIFVCLGKPVCWKATSLACPPPFPHTHRVVILSGAQSASLLLVWPLAISIIAIYVCVGPWWQLDSILKLREETEGVLAECEHFPPASVAFPHFRK